MRILRKFEKVNVRPTKEAAMVILTEEGNGGREFRSKVSLSDAVEINRALSKSAPSGAYKTLLTLLQRQSQKLKKVHLVRSPDKEFCGMVYWDTDGSEDLEVYELIESILIALFFDGPLCMDESVLEMYKAPVDEVKFNIAYVTEHFHEAEIRAVVLQHLGEMELNSLNRLLAASIKNEEYLIAAKIKKEIELRATSG